VISVWTVPKLSALQVGFDGGVLLVLREAFSVVRVPGEELCQGQDHHEDYEEAHEPHERNAPVVGAHHRLHLRVRKLENIPLEVCSDPEENGSEDEERQHGREQGEEERIELVWLEEEHHHKVKRHHPRNSAGKDNEPPFLDLSNHVILLKGGLFLVETAREHPYRKKNGVSE